MVDETLWREFGATLLRQGLDYSAGVDILLAWFIEHGLTIEHIGRDANSLGFKPRNMRYHQLLEVILESKSPGAREAIIKNTRIFAHASKITGPKTDDELDKDLDLMIEGLAKDIEEEVKEREKPKSRKSPSE